MKKFLLFILLVIWVGSSLASITVTIGTGTSITGGSTSTITPYRTYWEDGQDQILFTATELSIAGLGAGNIEKLAFNVGGTPDPATLHSFTISMQQIPGTSISSFITSGWTVCYTSNVVAVAGWNTYTFTTPFFWDGISSLVFKVCYNNNSWTSNSHVYYSSPPSTGVHLSWGTDLPYDSGCDVTSATNNVERPNVQITGQPADACTGEPNPGNTISTSYSLCPNVSFTLSLQYPTLGSGVTFQWQTSASGGDPWTNVGPSSPTYTTSQTSTTYYRCQVTCSGNTGTSNPVLVAIGAPVPGNTISSANPICAGVNFTLSLQYPTTGVETYQWQSSATGGDPWTNTGTNSPTCTTSLTASTFYHCLVTCGGNTGTSNAVQVMQNYFYNCYCPSKPNNSADEEIFTVTIGGNTNAYACTTIAPGPGSILNIYSNFFPLGSLFNLPQSNFVPFTIQEDECDGPTYFQNGCAIWVDFNKNGDFTDAGEQVFSEAGITVSPRTITGSIAVPADAPLGETAMRITVAEGYSGSSLTPCLSYGYGETEDYKVTITPAIACPQPYDLNSSAITTTSANLYWTPGGPETSWEYAFGAYPLPLPSGSGIATSSNTTNPLSGLLSNTKYQFYVREYCGGEFTDWTGPSTFKTLCDPFTTPISENFDGVSWPLLPDCWSVINSSTLSGGSVQTNPGGPPHSFPNNVIFNNNTDPNEILLLITPEITTDLGTLQVKFWAKGVSTGFILNVGTMSDPSDAGSYTQYISIPLSATYMEYTVSLSGYSGTDSYIAFKHGLGDPYRIIYLDDIQIFAPSSLHGFVYDYNGNPVSGATVVRVGGISAISGPDGDYMLSSLPFGTQQFKCSKAGYNDVILTIDIPEGTAVMQDFTLPNPEMAINPPSLYEVLLPTQMSTIDLSVINDGNGILDWQSGFLYPGGGSCVYTIKLWDTYGDGWNGGKLDVMVNGIVVLNDITLNSGTGPAIFNFTITGGGQITTVFIPGSWPMEPYYYIYNCQGAQVWYSPAGGSGPPNILPGQLLGIGDDWLSMDFSGIASPFGGIDTVPVHFDATKAGDSGGVPGESYTAEIVFSSSPDIGSITVPVTLVIADETLAPPSDLTINVVNAGQGKFKLTWNFNPSRTPSHFIILRNGQLIGTSVSNTYIDDLDDPGHYCYKVCCVNSDGAISLPSNIACLDYPLPPSVPLSNWVLVMAGLLIGTYSFLTIRRR